MKRFRKSAANAPQTLLIADSYKGFSTMQVYSPVVSFFLRLRYAGRKLFLLQNLYSSCVKPKETPK